MPGARRSRSRRGGRQVKGLRAIAVGRVARWGFLSLGAGLAATWSLDYVFPPDLAALRTVSTQVVDRDGALLRAFPVAEGTWRLPARAAAVDPRYIALLRAVEDQRLGSHPGVDPLAALRAASQLAATGTVVSGASTLAMQLARLIEPRPRTLGAKLIESARALQLTMRLGSAGVLDAYLTLAPFGGNVQGVRAASLAYLGKEPARLSLAEAALLVALPRSPTHARPDRHPDAAKALRDRVLARAVAVGLASADEAAAAASEALPGRVALPLLAAHVAESLARATPPGGVVRTPIDGYLQAQVEDLLRRRAAGIEESASIAALVVAIPERTVVAAVGGPDLFDARRAGAVDLTAAQRSPGSALKPMIYGLAFQDGIAAAQTVIDDLPMSYAGYRPENFDLGHSGPVTARLALIRSLNLPAVALLDRVGPGAFAASLRAAGIALAQPRPEVPPGLAYALGGVGVSLRDLVTIFVAIADGGRAGPLVWDRDAAPPGDVQLLDAQAARTVIDILADSAPPAGWSRAVGRRIAYKTGTSYGFRDAWAIGTDGRHVAGVWTGRPDGTPRPGVTGARAAAPILFEIFGSLPAASAQAAARSGFDSGLAQAQPPAALRRLALRGQAGWEPDPDAPLAIAFPPDGARIALSEGGQMGVLPIKVQGGQGSLTLLVNGQPLALAGGARAARELVKRAFWQPDGPGFAEIAAIDAIGRRAAVVIRID
ncbi:MAG: penicillin-binding protein 1C [Alphaproteobacteria bacterium]|nr:penicillin-binding protein 1C [Alphaproteobacteria bacterium]